TADQMTIRTVLIAALGCNLAWGIIDAGMYLMARLGERGHNAVVAHAIRKARQRHFFSCPLPVAWAGLRDPARLRIAPDDLALVSKVVFSHVSAPLWHRPERMRCRLRKRSKLSQSWQSRRDRTLRNCWRGQFVRKDA